MIRRIAGSRISGLRSAARIAPSRGGSDPPDPPGKRPRRATTIGFSAQSDADPPRTRPCRVEFKTVLGLRARAT
eukprot:9304715-Alexandrium_andersonii.AAC.1